MNDNNQEKLLKDFPQLYKRFNESITQTSMAMGFQCGNGWFGLIYELSGKIDSQLKKEPKESAGRFAVEQVKEKFGRLAYSTIGGSEAISQLICEAKARSAKTCETCGKPGKLRRYKGFRQGTLCDFCNARF